MSGYKIAALTDIEEMNDGRQPWRPVRMHMGIRGFGVNSWTAAKEGDRIINEHTEEEGEDEELYIVMYGHATFEIDGERKDAPAGTLVFVPTGVKRTAYAEADGTTLLAIGAPVGRAYEVFGWELWSPFNQLYQDGKYAEAADAARPVAEQNPGNPGLFYNLACVESLAGRKEDAIKHLTIAVSESNRMREYAKGDTDLDPIRNEPGFPELSS